MVSDRATVRRSVPPRRPKIHVDRSTRRDAPRGRASRCIGGALLARRVHQASVRRSGRGWESTRSALNAWIARELWRRLTASRDNSPPTVWHWPFGPLFEEVRAQRRRVRFRRLPWPARRRVASRTSRRTRSAGGDAPAGGTKFADCSGATRPGIDRTHRSTGPSKSRLRGRTGGSVETTSPFWQLQRWNVDPWRPRRAILACLRG